ncbi:MAG: bifunctional metallophosphatase/5'-nucleotidase [Ktedonobacterales bacterium]
MQRITLFHTNDLHARIEQLARAATLIEYARAESLEVPVLFFDGGDSEDHSVRLSNLTKGVAMHRLLSAAGCNAAAVGNAALPRYGPAVLAAQARAASYPLLLANLRQSDGAPLRGTRPSALLQVRGVRLGLIGVTAELDGVYEKVYGLRALPVLPLIRELAAQLRQEGADGVLVLSHLGLAGDRALAAEVQGSVELIIGAHSHSLLPEGERIGDVALAQAGEYGEHLGRVDLRWDGERLCIERMRADPVPLEAAPSPAVLTAVAAAENEVTRLLAEVIGELAQPLDFAEDRECGVGNLTADALREHMGAEVGLVTAGHAFTGGLPGGPLRRGTLWEVCNSPANPALATLSGAQLLALVRTGLDPALAAERPRMFRGQARALMHLSGAEVRDGRLLVGGVPLEPARTYRVAATDWELDVDGGYAQPRWALDPQLDLHVILREALEAYLALHRPVDVPMGRVAGALDAN